MKRAAVAATLLAALLAASLWNIRCLDRFTDSVLAELDRSEAMWSAGDFAAAADALSQAKDKWDSKKAYTHVFIRHAEVDSVSDSFCELLSQLKTSDEGAAGGYEKLRYHIRCINEMEHISLGSVF